MRISDWSSDVCSSDLILARLEQRQRILGEATPAIARPCMQELGTDAIIQANAPRHVLHVSPHLFAQIGNLIDESDLGRQKRIGGIFGEFGAPAGHHDQRRLRSEEHTSELQSLMRISYAVFCLKKKINRKQSKTAID